MSGNPTTQGLVERPGRDSLRARWSEVESKGKSEQLYAHFVVRRKVHDRRFVAAGALHCHLPRFKLNLMLFGFADDRAAEILVQLEIGQLARSDRPARDDSQCKNS